MTIRSFLSVAAMAGGLVLGLQVGTVAAQVGAAQPAEFPPASYKGKQYVDSQGCVFIRAGIDGNVTWVPRVSRDRKVVCGFRPTLSDQVAEAPAEAPAAPEITLNPEPVQTVEALPAPKPKPARAAPRVVRQTAAKPRRARQPVEIAVSVDPTPAPAPVQVVVQADGVVQCEGGAPISAQYLRGRGVRCGPQTAPILPSGSYATDVAVDAPVYAQGITTTTRIVPKHVAENRVNTRNVSVPKGYRPIWTDDRLNPYRAEQNLQGRADMLLVWTQTVPRRLVDQRSGQDVTAKVPLIYPYTSIEQQRAEVGEVTLVSRDGQVMKKVVRRQGSRAPVYSSRSAPKAAPVVTERAQPVAVTGGRYVQIGTFSQQGNAQRAAQRIAEMGMGARIGTQHRGGQKLMTVQAGPFADDGSLQRAVARLRGAGYRDAFVR